MNPMVTVIESMTKFLWGDLLRIPLPGGSSIGLSLMVLLLIPAGIFYTDTDADFAAPPVSGDDFRVA